MPIPGDQFEKGLDKTKFLMLEFLRKNPNFAYNMWEIVEGIGVSTKSQGLVKLTLIAWGFGSSLDKMAEEGLIDKKIIDGQSLYRIHKI